MDEYNILRKKRKKNGGFATTAIIVSLAVILILVALFVFLLGKVDKKEMSNTNGNQTSSETNCKDNNCSTVVNCNSKERIFNNNLRDIKDAAVSYFTNERLPQKIGEKKTITLSKMQEEKIILDVLDSNDKSCDKNKTYVEVTKEKNEYVMKINLSCSDMEDYIIIHLGCYDYCKDNICEKQDEKGVTEFEYEYKKVTSCTMSEWSNWSEWTTTREKTSDLKKEDTKTETITKTKVETKDIIKGTTTYDCSKYGKDYVLTSDNKYCVKYGSKVISVPGTPTDFSSICEDKTYSYNSKKDICEKKVPVSEVLEKEATKNPDTFNCSEHPGTEYNSKTGKCEGLDKKKVNVIPGKEYCTDKDAKIVNGKCVTTKPSVVTETKSCSEYGSEYKLNNEGMCEATIPKTITVKKVPEYKTVTEKQEYSCWKYEGTTKRVFDCSSGSCKMVPQTSYEKVLVTCTKDVEVQKVVGEKCPSYAESGSDGKCYNTTYDTDKQPAKIKYSAPSCTSYGSDYKLSGNNKDCVKTENVKVTESVKNCDTYGKDYKIDGNYCVAKTSYDAKKNTTTYSCDYLKNDGYSLVDVYTNKCVKTHNYEKTLTMKATKISGGIKCEDGFTPNGKNCEKTEKVEVDKKQSNKIVTPNTCPYGYKQNNGKCTKTIEEKVKVVYYRYATRTCTGGSTSIKWSSSKTDQELIKNGYKLTGNKREILDK